MSLFRTKGNEAPRRAVYSTGNAKIYHEIRPHLFLVLERRRQLETVR